MQDSHHPDGACGDTVDDSIGELLHDAFPRVSDAMTKLYPQQGNPFKAAFDLKETIPRYGF